VTVIGLIVPSSNLSIERTLAAGQLSDLLNADLAVTRLSVTEISSSAVSRQQFSAEALREAATLLNEASPDVIVWTGTSGLWLGLAEEQEILDQVGSALGVPMVSAAGGVVRALSQAGDENITVLTPYVTNVHVAVLQALGALGYRVGAEHCLELSDNYRFAEVPAELIDAALLRLGRSPGPTVVVCTNLPIATGYRGQMIDSLVAMLWFGGVTAGATLSDYADFHERLVGRLRYSSGLDD
jgi:maleate isomerase